jgi:hypothetical protein
MADNSAPRVEQMIPKDFLDLADVQARHEEELLSKPHVVGVALGNKIKDGVDTGQPAITVLVDAKLDESLLTTGERVKKKLDDVPTDVVAVGVIQAGPAAAPPVTAPPDLAFGRLPELQFAPNGGAVASAVRTVERELTPEERLAEDVRALTLRDRIRPAMGGYSVGHYQITAGTIATGCYDWIEFPDIPSRFYLLSNNHVLANSNAARLGDPILQPGPYDGGTVLSDVVGRLTRWVPIQWITSTSTPINYVDAAIAEVDFHSLTREVYYIGYMRRLYVAPTVGDIVQKTGRTTNFSTGRITNVNATVDVNYGGGRVARFARQILAQTRDGHAMGAPGDSGSLVSTLEEEGVGLLFAGSGIITVINHLDYVQYLLAVRITEM